MKTETNDEPRSGSLHVLVGPSEPRWTYSTYRASLLLDGKPFAIVTPDGRKPLPEEAMTQLLAALNGPTVRDHQQGERR